MPTYEYICGNCKYEFEKIQSIKDDSLTKCPKCHKEKLTLKSTRKIEEIIQSKLEERNKDYKKIIGRLYLKTPRRAIK